MINWTPEELEEMRRADEQIEAEYAAEASIRVRRYQERNRERVRACQKAWRAAHPEKVAEYNRKAKEKYRRKKEAMA